MKFWRKNYLTNRCLTNWYFDENYFWQNVFWQNVFWQKIDLSNFDETSFDETSFDETSFDETSFDEPAWYLRDTGFDGYLLPPDQIIPTGEETWAFHKSAGRQLIKEFGGKN
jgi:hypothetical protein